MRADRAARGGGRRRHASVLLVLAAEARQDVADADAPAPAPADEFGSPTRRRVRKCLRLNAQCSTAPSEADRPSASSSSSGSARRGSPRRRIGMAGTVSSCAGACMKKPAARTRQAKAQAAEAKRQDALGEAGIAGEEQDRGYAECPVADDAAEAGGQRPFGVGGNPAAKPARAQSRRASATLRRSESTVLCARSRQPQKATGMTTADRADAEKLHHQVGEGRAGRAHHIADQPRRRMVEARILHVPARQRDGGASRTSEQRQAGELRAGDRGQHAPDIVGQAVAWEKPRRVVRIRRASKPRRCGTEDATPPERRLGDARLRAGLWLSGG